MAENGPCYKRYSRHLLFFATLIIDRTRSPAFQAASGLFEKISGSYCIFLSKLSLIQNPDPPGKGSSVKTQPPGQ